MPCSTKSGSNHGNLSRLWWWLMTAFFAAGVYNQVCLQNSRVLGILIAINVSEIHIQRLLIKTSHHDQVSGLGEDLQRGKQNIAVLEVATACFIRKAPSSKGSASYRCNSSWCLGQVCCEQGEMEDWLQQQVVFWVLALIRNPFDQHPIAVHSWRRLEMNLSLSGVLHQGF